jgi:hypothetical protein
LLCCHYGVADHFRHMRRVAVAERRYPSLSLAGILTRTPSIHWDSCEVIGTPITSGSGCPLDALNRGWDRLPGALQSRAVKAGKDEHAPSLIRRTNVASLELNSGTVPAKAANVVSDLGLPRGVSRGLLHDKPFTAHVDPGATEVWPQARVCAAAMNSGSGAGALTRGTSDDDMAGWRLECSNIVMDWYAWELLSDALAAPRVDLTERHCADASTRKAQRVVANA